MRDGLIAAGAIVCAVCLAVIAIYVLRKPMPCALNSCSLELHEQDSGGVFTYILTSRIGVVLDARRDPPAHLNFSCSPQDTLGSISNVPPVQPPLYALRYEGVQPGTCTIADDHFHVTITIVNSATTTTS